MVRVIKIIKFRNKRTFKTICYCGAILEYDCCDVKGGSAMWGRDGPSTEFPKERAYIDCPHCKSQVLR